MKGRAYTKRGQATAWKERFNLKSTVWGNQHRRIGKLAEQLSMCQSDEARRLIIGISEKEEVKSACTA